MAQTGPVYADELANFLHVNYGGASAPQIFLMLDNEPNYWGSTHPELWPYTGSLPCETATVLFDDVVTRDKSFATGIKTAWPGAKVVGPVVAQDGVIYAHSYSADPHYPAEFLDYYLQQMQDAGATYGAPLLDYNGVIHRVQYDSWQSVATAGLGFRWAHGKQQLFLTCRNLANSYVDILPINFKNPYVDTGRTTMLTYNLKF